MEHIYWQNFDNLGIIKSHFNIEELQPIVDEIDKIQNNFSGAVAANKNLSGNIKREFLLKECKSYLETILSPLVFAHQSNYAYLSSINVLKKPVPIKLDSIWVNFQQKHEFNPIHRHDGILSFVIWINLPYKIEDEYAMFPDSRTQDAANFNFVYSNALGIIEMHKIPADKTYEGEVILFPAGLNHCVHPFYTSDEYRISVSGNFIYDNS